MSRILVAEDEVRIAEFVEKGLRAAGYSTTLAQDGRTALLLAGTGTFDLVILDLGLPGLGGLEVLKTVRAGSSTPVIILTARDEEVDELLGLGLGADDYLVKPVSARKLMARVRAVLRRTQNVQPETTLRSGTLEVDTYSRVVRVGGRAPELTRPSSDCFTTSAKTPGRAVSRSELYEAAMPESDALERAVDIHITNLRRKLREAGADSPIETVRGLGYRLAGA